MPLSEDIDSLDHVPHGYTVAPAGRDVAWAIALLAAFRFAIQVGVPLTYIVTGNTQLSEAHQVAIYCVVTVADLGALVGTAYYFACRKYGETFCGGFRFHSVRLDAFAGSAFAAACLVAFDLTVTSQFGEQPTDPVWLLAPPLGAVAVSVELLLQPFAYVLFYCGFVYGAFRALSETRAFVSAIGLYAVQSWLGRGPVSLMIAPAIMATVLTVQTSRYNSVVPALVTLFLHRLVMVALLTKSFVTGDMLVP